MIKVLSLFSGIGAFERALENLKVPYELVGYCEIDKFASKSFALLHGVSEDLNLRDVTQVDTSRLPGGIDLVTYGFPCQDISLAGRQKGLEHNGEKTRSGLVWDAHRIIGEVKPKVAICENVKNLTGKKFTKEFKEILENLEKLGYNNYYQVLNAKDYSVPQSRERVFIVSIKKDIDEGSFTFPEKQELKLCLADILDKEVDEKYYLSDEIVLKFLETFNLTDKEPTNKIRQVGNIVTTGNFENPQRGRIYNPVGICPSLNTVGGGGLEPKVIVYDSYNGRVRADQKTIGTITTMIGRSSPRAGQKIIENYGENYRIRKLTPRECFALMGFQKEDADKLSGSGISNSQLYKQAGNSIVVNVLMGIFGNLKGTLYNV